MKDAIDLFAGCGGATFGAEMTGLKVHWAANHSKLAVQFHKLNHPEVEHSCQDLRQADFSRLPDFKIMLASPCCQGFTKARGKEHYRHDDSRSTAWAVIDCLEAKRPPYGVVENVPEFVQWSLYPVWKLACERLGYHVHENVLDAADFGVPQNRVRAYLTLVHNKVLNRPIKVRSPGIHHQSASEILDWEGGTWSSVHDKVPNTVARWRSGRAAHGDRFLMPYYGSGSGKTGRDLNRPVGTITTKDRWALVHGDRMRMLSVQECRRAMGFPDRVKLPVQRVHAVRMLGNAVCPPVLAGVIKQVLRAA